MRFDATRLAGVFAVNIEPHLDARGFFARTWCSREFADHGLHAQLVQSSLSRNLRCGTVRGMHMQLPPSAESKLVSCIAGAIYDVVVDLRPDSPTFMEHVAIELSAGEHNALYIPPLMAHGFQTLTDDTEVMYQMSDFHAPQLGFGFRWDDPAFAIPWPIRRDISIIERDAGYPDFDARMYLERARAGLATSSGDTGERAMAEVPFADWSSAADCSGLTDEMLQLMHELYPICRSITGAGVRETLRIIGQHIPLEVTEVPSGRPVFDWEVPLEWNIKSAQLTAPDGSTVVDFAANNLHLVSYSTPVDASLTLDELRPHLHSLPAHPDWIPYRTSYYKQSWGFCLRHSTLESLQPGNYHVRIDSTLAPGSLTFAECVVPGESTEEFLIFTHTCHPSLCNDNLTGMAIATQLAAQLRKVRPRFTYRFVFAPGTIGSITWLALNESNVHRVRHGLVLGLLGDRGALTYKRSRRSQAEIDSIAEYVLRQSSPTGRVVDFSPYGYDERQLCSPGFNLPVGRLTRSPNDDYPQYHSSADDFSIIDPRSMGESLLACGEIIKTAERNAAYVNLSPKCEPRLGKRGLYRPTGGNSPGAFEHALLWILNQSDGTNSLLQIAARSGLPFDLIANGADALREVGLLRVAGIEEPAGSSQ